MRGKQVAGVLIAGLCALAECSAQADCASQCAYAYGGYGSYNYTTRYQIQCTHKKSFGALAFGSSSDAYGYSWGKSNASQAQQTAMVNCRASGDDCKIVANFSNACAAVARWKTRNALWSGKEIRAPTRRTRR
jgi:hypothetical protein